MLCWDGRTFLFSQSFFRYSTLLMHGSHSLCSISCPYFCFVPTMEHNTISWIRAELHRGWTCDMFQSIFKCFPVERDHYWYWVMLTLASHLQLFPFTSSFPFTNSTCWIANCVWIAAHGHCMCVCYCRYMTPSQFLLEDTRVFPFGWTKKKKSPCSQKLDNP